MNDGTRKSRPEIEFEDAPAGTADPCRVYPQVPGIDCRPLSGETLYVGGEERSYNHVFAMESATRERIDRLIADLAKPGAFPPQQELRAAAAPTPEAQVSAGGRPLTLVPHSGRGWR